MARTCLDDATWASLRTVVQRIPRVWKTDDEAMRRFFEAVLWIARTGAPWRDLPEEFGLWPSVFHRFRRWTKRGWWDLVWEHLHPMCPADGVVFADSTTCKAHRSATGAAGSNQTDECLGRSRGGLCSKLHACVDDTGAVLRIRPSPGQHSDLRHAWPLLSGDQ